MNPRESQARGVANVAENLGHPIALTLRGAEKTGKAP